MREKLLWTSHNLLQRQEHFVAQGQAVRTELCVVMLLHIWPSEKINGNNAKACPIAVEDEQATLKKKSQKSQDHMHLKQNKRTIKQKPNHQPNKTQHPPAKKKNKKPKANPKSTPKENKKQHTKSHYIKNSGYLQLCRPTTLWNYFQVAAKKVWNMSN